jgi:glyceraldehyde 3-phosphate dehydrogenase
MKKIKIGLNGFGRIGRAITRIATLNQNIEIVHINTRKTDNQMLAYLLKYDSVYRKFVKNITFNADGIVVDNHLITTSQQEDPSLIPWGSREVQIVIDATGAFLTTEKLSAHLKDSVKRVILTAPAKDEEIPHVVLGVNEIPTNKKIVSNASCTTNCAAPMFKILDDHFKIVSGSLTTAHAYTQTQSLLDDPGKNIERSRSAPLNIIPSTTGAAKAVTYVIPNLQGKIDGMALRVPVATGSFTDITCVVEKDVTKEEVNSVFKNAALNEYQGIVEYADDILVSSDIIGSASSVIFDPNYTKVIGNRMVKVYGWYDNEWGYSSRVVDLATKLSDFA